MKQPNAWSFVCFVLGCAAEMDANRPVQDAEPPKLLAQRVTGTVKREAAPLVHIQTGHEVLLTTPEHPFATPGSGWISAGQLAPGDWVVSAKFGVVRVLSVHSEMPSHPVAVFNLSVDRSHAYLVGRDQVLVHNRRQCKDPAERSKEIEEAEREVQELEREQTLATTAEDKARIEQRIAEAKSQLAKLKDRARVAKRYQKKKSRTAAGPNQEPVQEAAPVRDRPEEDALTRDPRALEALEGQVETLKADPSSAENKTEIQKRLDALLQERKKIKNRIGNREIAAKKRRGEHVPLAQRQLQRDQAEYESAEKALEATQSALRELEAQTPGTDGENATARTRKVDLDKRLKEQEVDYEGANRVLVWQRRVVEIERAQAIGDRRPELEREKSALRAEITKERGKKDSREYARRKRADPEQKKVLLEADRRTRRRRYRRAAYVADTQRPRDTFELMQEELAALREQPASPTRDQRIAHLTDAVETLTKLVEIRRKIQKTMASQSTALRKHKELFDEGKDTKEIDQTITRVSQELAAMRAERNALRAQALLLGIEEARGRKAVNGIDEARLTELEREWAETLPGESDTLDAEFFEEIWREAESDSAAAQEAMQNEAEDVDAELLALAESIRTSPSPERAAAVASSLQALQNGLREERSAVEAADFALANEHASLSQTLPRPGSSRHAAGVQRLAEVQQQRLELRTQWRERMQLRLDGARQELRALQSIAGSRNEALEADMARQITLLEHEVKHPAF